MGRNRTFDESEVIAQCARAFRSTGYEGTSIDDLVRASGLHRGSLYKAFGSKRGLFLLALRQSSGANVQRDDATDLLLVALIELAHRDLEVRSIVFEIVNHQTAGHTAESLGQRLLDRTRNLAETTPSTKDDR